MLACTGTAFNADDILGLSAALGSTFVFVAQNIYSKKLLSRPSGAGDEKLDKMSLLYYSSACSVVVSALRHFTTIGGAQLTLAIVQLMLPLFVYNDLPKLLGSSPGPTDPHHLQHLTDHVVDPSLAVDASVLSPAATVGAMGVIWLLMSNGVVHFAQSVLAFSESIMRLLLGLRPSLTPCAPHPQAFWVSSHQSLTRLLRSSSACL